MVIEYPVGNITQIRDGAQQTVYFDNAVVSPDQRFEYDPLYRLTHAEGREHTALTQPTHADLSFGPQPHPNDPSALRTYEEAYAWDEVGNLLQLQHAASGGNFTRQYVYAAAGNRLLSNSAPGESTAPFSHSYTYDAHGNMTSMPHLAAMAWDHADRLQHCDLGGGGDVWFVYDAAGNRVRKVQVNTSGSTVRERIYVGAWEVWRERTGIPLAVEQERQTLHVGDDRGKLALVETLTVDDGDPVATPISIQRHQHGNHLGSAALELDANAAVISYEEFHPFGTSSYAANDSGIEVSAKRYRYIGKERDEETGLYHLGARYYASWLGRWTAADPIGLGDGVNQYGYSSGDPVGLRDPSGRAGEGGFYDSFLRAAAAGREAPVRDDSHSGTAPDLDETAHTQPLESLDPTERPGPSRRGRDSIVPIHDEVRGHISKAFDEASAAQFDPSKSRWEREFAAFKATALAPLALLDKGREGLINAPRNADLALQYGARATRQQNPTVALDDLNQAIQHGVAAILGVAEPFSLRSGGSKVSATKVSTAKDEGGKTVSVFHGSIDDATTIQTKGLDPRRTPVVVTRDVAAAQDAIGPARTQVRGGATDPGIIESRIPEAEFNSGMAQAERPYEGFYPYPFRNSAGKPTSTEIPLRTEDLVRLFNTYIVGKP